MMITNRFNFKLSIFLAAAVTLGLVFSTMLLCEACTTILVGKGATADGSVIVAHTEEMGTYSGRLLYFPKKTQEEKDIYVNYATIPQVPVTNAFWAAGNSEPVAKKHYDGGWVLDAMNEYGVIVCDNYVETKEELIPGKTPGTLLRYSLRALIMERAKTAREGVELLGNFIDKYGQSGTCVCDMTIADSNEAWIVGLGPRHWVARRIPDNSIHVVANRKTIETTWDLASAHLINYAISRGWYDPAKGSEPFNYKNVYGAQLGEPYDVMREYQDQSMLQHKIGKITVEDVLSVLTLPPVQNTDTQSFQVFHLRNNMPREIGSLMWFGMSSGNSSVMVPVYAGSSSVPDPYTFAEYNYDPVSAWWQFEQLQRRIYPRTWEYSHDYLDVRQKLNQFQEIVFKRNADVENKAINLYKEGQIEKVKNLLTDHTYSNLVDALVEVKTIFQQLK